MHGTSTAQYLLLSWVVLISLASCQGNYLGLNLKMEISRLEKLMVSLTKGFHEMRNECGKYIKCEKKCSEALSFGKSGKNIAEYAKFDEGARPINGDGVANGGLDGMTSCFWIKAQKNFQMGTVLSYAVSARDNEFLIYLTSNLKVTFKNRYRRAVGISLYTGVEVTDGKWHHVCVTWKSSGGSVEVYKDGVCIFKKTGVIAGQRLESSGIWIIGQDQDTYDGGFQLKDAFQGSLTEVNVWNRVLDASEISTLASKKCGLGMQGNYVAYSDFVPYGSVQKFKPSCCD